MANGTTSEGLIELPPVPAGDGGLLPSLVIGWTILLLLGTMLVDVFAPVKRPTLKGGEAFVDRRRRETAKFADGSLARLLEYDYRITSRVRRTIAQPYTDLLFQYLGETSGEVLVGSDDWLFLERRAQWMLGTGTVGIERSAALEAALSARVASLGSELIWMHIPRKAAIEADQLPRGIVPRVDLERLIAPAVQDRGAIAIDLMEPFLQMEDEPAYRKTDSHWSSYGRAVAALETAQQSGRLVPEAERPGRVEEVENNGRHGAILNTMSVTATPRLKALEPARRITVRNPPPRGLLSPAVISGTSFTSPELANLLAHYFGMSFQAIGNRGGSPYDKLGAIFSQRLDDDRPETRIPDAIVLDVPNHIVMMAGRFRGNWPINPRAAQFLADRPPPATYPVTLSREILSAPFQSGQRVPFQDATTLATWRLGDVAHTGDGALSLELDLNVEGEGVTLLLFSREASLTVKLKAGANHLVLPLIAPRPDALPGRIGLKRSGEGAVSVKTCRLVATSLRKVPVDGSTIERHGVVLIRTAATGDQPRQAHVTVTSADGEASQTFHFKGVRPGAPIAVTPGKLIGRRLGNVTLEGPPGSRPENSLQIESVQALSPPTPQDR